MKDYERVARSSPDRLAEALIARHNVRMTNLTRLPEAYRVLAIEAMGPIAILDPSHHLLGMTLNRAPVEYTGKFPRDLAWGVDSQIAAVRLLLSGQIVGAATIARQQLERWTVVLARAAGLAREEGESIANYFARSWTAFDSFSPESRVADAQIDLQDLDAGIEEYEPGTDEPGSDHQHIVLSDGTEICPGAVYGYLSEIMHARECHDVTSWESEWLLDPRKMPTESALPIKAIADAISLSLIQIGMLTAVGLHRVGKHTEAYRLANYKSWPHRFSERDLASESREWWAASTSSDPGVERAAVPTSGVSPTLVSLMPLTPTEGLRKRNVAYLEARYWTYIGMRTGYRPAGRLYRDDEMVTLVFDAHRYSSAQFARSALDAEAALLGDSFDLHTLDSRGTVYIVVSELAAVASIWTAGAVSAALKLISSSLRSAYWLWLEDDDRAMACLRCALEQAARVVATVEKPRKAERLENSPAPTSRWLEAAGWKRLNALNQAIGEYAHVQKKVDPLAGRLLLSALQMDVDPDKDSIMTARGNALDLVTEFAARSVLTALRTVSSTVADTALQLLEAGMLDLSQKRKEEVLNHSMKLRNAASAPSRHEASQSVTG